MHKRLIASLVVLVAAGVMMNTQPANAQRAGYRGGASPRTAPRMAPMQQMRAPTRPPAHPGPNTHPPTHLPQKGSEGYRYYRHYDGGHHDHDNYYFSFGFPVAFGGYYGYSYYDPYYYSYDPYGYYGYTYGCY